MYNILEKIFSKAVKIKNHRYDRGISSIVHCNIPVISIGNISSGGSSKTPFAMMTSELLLHNGIKPAIVARGYKKQKKGLIIVRDEAKIISTLAEAGDEMLMIAEKLQVPIIVSESKTEAALFAETNFNPDCIIIDDGFQHRRLHRDLDIVLINEETLLKPQLLPAGRLREPPSSLNRADIICFVGISSNHIEDTEIFLSDIILKQDVIICRAEVSLGNPYRLYNRDNINQESEIIISKAAAVAGIAGPQRFLRSLIEAGYRIEKTFWYGDHFKYQEKEILNLIKKLKYFGLTTFFTTEKDAVKLREYKKLFADNGIECLIAPMELEFTEGKELFEKKLLNLFINHFGVEK